MTTINALLRHKFLAVTFIIVICNISVFCPAYSQVEAIKQSFLNAESPHILVAAHRAAHKKHPENSIAAIKEAIRLGVDIIEIDVKVSKDGVPMLMHDGKIDRTTNGKGDLEEQTYKELRKLHLVQDGKKTGEVIPTLREALEVAKGKIMVDLDLKTDRIDEVIEVVKSTKTEDIVFFFDSDYQILSKVDAVSKQFMLMPRAHNIAMADSAIKLFKPEVIHIDDSFNTPEVCKLIKNNHARIWINALGKPDELIQHGNVKQAVNALIANGANVIQTDQPEKILKYLKENKLHR